MQHVLDAFLNCCKKAASASPVRARGVVMLLGEAQGAFQKTQAPGASCHRGGGLPVNGSHGDRVLSEADLEDMLTGSTRALAATERLLTMGRNHAADQISELAGAMRRESLATSTVMEDALPFRRLVLEPPIYPWRGAEEEIGPCRRHHTSAHPASLTGRQWSEDAM
jgi:hypothetical protein